MSQYNKYAQRLDTAFKTAREEYMEAWNQLQAAQKANTDAQAWRAETYRGENDPGRAESQHRRPGVESGNLPGRERPKTAAGKGATAGG